MYGEIRLSLKKLSSDYYKVIKYLVRHSDSFTVVMKMVRPYSKWPNPCRQVKYSDRLNDYLIDQILNAREWPYTKTNAKHLALCKYKCQKSIVDELCMLPSLFECHDETIPRDLCFYRNNTCWFATVIHEEWAFAINPTNEDRLFLQPYEGLDKPYFL